jgi:hypothetical protein
MKGFLIVIGSLIVFFVVAVTMGKRAHEHLAGIGETVTIPQSNGYWPCGSTTDALEEMTKWAARGDTHEVARTMLKTNSGLLRTGMQVKVLDSGIGTRKVRIEVDADGKTVHGVSECWVAMEALAH